MSTQRASGCGCLLVLVAIVALASLWLMRSCRKQSPPEVAAPQQAAANPDLVNDQVLDSEAENAKDISHRVDRAREQQHTKNECDEAQEKETIEETIKHTSEDVRYCEDLSSEIPLQQPIHPKVYVRIKNEGDHSDNGLVLSSLAPVLKDVRATRRDEVRTIIQLRESVLHVPYVTTVKDSGMPYRDEFGKPEFDANVLAIDVYVDVIDRGCGCIVAERQFHAGQPVNPNDHYIVQKDNIARYVQGLKSQLTP